MRPNPPEKEYWRRYSSFFERSVSKCNFIYRAELYQTFKGSLYFCQISKRFLGQTKRTIAALITVIGAYTCLDVVAFLSEMSMVILMA